MSEEIRYVAAIGTAPEVVEGEFCDVSVIESEIVGYRPVDGEEIPEWGLTDRVAMEAVSLRLARTDDEHKLQYATFEARAVLAERGWCVASEWEASNNALYAPVERI